VCRSCSPLKPQMRNGEATIHAAHRTVGDLTLSGLCVLCGFARAFCSSSELGVLCDSAVNSLR
jgi:hypothetical protein